ncbi:DUF1995 domain-containing protein [Cephalotus follicularis]|uniref:DUF1995 domain-containing protein n=1 Tax=Cephalotus follicularis TaxID=3775 RepID=A0A1Q3DEG9_CEPFO|nr:DUF1995 domain-containing protein [Cephalotus follicularis]
MASNLLKIHPQTINLNTTNSSSPFTIFKTPFPSLSFPTHHHHHYHHVSYLPSTLSHEPKTLPLHLHSSLSASTPPTSREDAVLQAKTCLSTTLEKPLNNPKLSGKLKKVKQPRYRVEIPLLDDSPQSLSLLAFDVFRDLPIKTSSSPVKILLLWPNTASTEAAIKAFEIHHSTNQIEHSTIFSVHNRILNSADVAVLLAPESSQLAVMRTVTNSLHPKPVVVLNPKWGFEEESEFGDLGGFVGTFEVIYSFMGLEVRGIMSKRKGVIFKCVRDGVLSGEKWTVLVEEEGELKEVSRFKARPSIGEVEVVLYNLMAINSPITKSAKFLKDLVSSVTGKK